MLCLPGKSVHFYVISRKWRTNNREIPVAIKEWKRQVVSRKEIIYLNREIEIQRKLDHLNCIKLYGTSKTPQGYPVLVMELAECSLTDLTTKRVLRNRAHPANPIKQLSNEEKLRIIKEIAEGIKYIHSQGFIHRDLKVCICSIISCVVGKYSDEGRSSQDC